MYMEEMLQNIQTGAFSLEVMVAVASSCFWVRLIFMLMLTSTFGPLITIIVNMF